MRSEAQSQRASTPWLRNLGLTLQTVRNEMAQDPAQFALQVSRRLPDRFTRPAAQALTRTGRLAGGALAQLGHQMLGSGETSPEQDRPGPDDGASRGALGQTLKAAVALGAGEATTTARLLDAVPVQERGGRWHAVRARLDVHQGDLHAAVEWARSHRGTRGLARRIEADRQVLFGHRPGVGAVRPGAPVQGRVLHVLNSSLPHTASGYAQRSHGILRAQAEAGFDVHAVTRPGYPVEVGIPWARTADVVDGVEYRRLLPRLLAPDAVGRLDQYAQLLSAEVERLRPAVLHTTTHFTNALVVGAVAEAHGLPWVYEVRGQRADSWAATRPPQALDSEYHRLFTQREAEAARSADAVVTLGENMQRVLLEAGVLEDRLHVCPNAVDPAFLPEPPTLREARTHLGLDTEQQIIGTVSSVVDYEGLDLLARALALLAPDRPGLRLRIVGDGVSLPSLRTLVEQLGVADRCQFTGRVDRALARWNHAALDVFVVPRRDLPVTRIVTPMKSVEASASGRPVVAADLPALAELVHDGVTGRLVTPDDPVALAGVLAKLLDDQQQREQLGQAGRHWALTTRTWGRNARTYTRMYAGLGVLPDLSRSDRN